MANVSIVEFDESLAKAFADLNYEWIAASYGIEEHDREILDHPQSFVIDNGGQVFFARIGDAVAGTVAMIRLGDDSFELAKMAVAPASQGKGISNLLMQACIGHAAKEGVSKIVLESNTKQAAAISLYRKFGFVETPLDPNSAYVRANIRMELAISPANM